MTSRDPLYDKNAPGSGETVDELLTDRNSGRTPSGTTGNLGGSGSSGMGGQDMQQMKDQAKGKAQDAASKAQDKAQDVASKAQDKADEVSSRAHDAADQGMDKASEGLDSAAEMLRQRGQEQGGKAGDMASTVADKLDSASGYLREKDTDQVVSDLEELVRRKPVESLLIAAGIGLLLSRIVR